MIELNKSNHLRASSFFSDPSILKTKKWAANRRSHSWWKSRPKHLKIYPWFAFVTIISAIWFKFLSHVLQWNGQKSGLASFIISGTLVHFCCYLWSRRRDGFHKRHPQNSQHWSKPSHLAYMLVKFGEFDHRSPSWSFLFGLHSHGKVTVHQHHSSILSPEPRESWWQSYPGKADLADICFCWENDGRCSWWRCFP